MVLRLTPWSAAGIGLAVVLTGCSPSPVEIEPTPTFSSEAEAFAAAEATYRAYVDALNEVDLSDPQTFEAVYAWTTGEANAGARETFSQMHSDRWIVNGQTAVALVEPGRVQTSPRNQFSLAVCLDVSAVGLTDERGESVVARDRRDVQSIAVTLVPDTISPTGALISKIEGRDGEPPCGE